MIASFVTRLVDLCIRHAWWVIGFTLILGAGGAFYVDRDFAINTDVNKLLSSDLPWKKRAAQYAAAFPERGIVVVLEAPTPELADDAASRLTDARLAQVFDVVAELDGQPRIIAFDHSDFDNGWFQTSIIETWRDGVALIRTSWIKHA